MGDNMTLYGYCRVSSEDQNSKGKSLDAQKEILLRRGVKESNIYIDGGKSGGIHEEQIKHSYTEGRYFGTIIDLGERKRFRELLTILQPNDSILFTKWDRISRRSGFIQNFVSYCEQKEVKLEPIEESADPLTRDILIVIAEAELNKTKSRNKSVQEYLYDQGIFPYAAPYGYIKNIKVDNQLRYPDLKEGALVIDTAQTAIVKECFRAAIKSRQTGNNTLYKEVCAKHGIDPSTYYRIIKNKVYMGMTKHQNQWAKTEHVPAIITEEEYNKANGKK